MVWSDQVSSALSGSCSVAASRKFYNYEDISKDSTESIPRTRDDSTECGNKLLEYIGENIIGRDTAFTSPYGLRKVVYCDYTASGRSVKFIEDYIANEVLPHYGSTHTTATHTALQTTMFRHEAKDVIRTAVRASECDRVLLTGTGATGAAVRLLHGLNLKQPPVVLAGPFLHHSALLPWREAGAKVIRVRESREGGVDMQHLEALLERERCSATSSAGPCPQVIGVFCAASNVTGVLADTVGVTVLLHRHGALAFWDYATAAPYVELDMNPVVIGDSDGLAHKDAMFFSVHKFIGGPQTPGVLVAKRALFRHPVPALPGGGSVFFVSHHSHRFLLEEETREEGGTPGIVGDVRAGLVLQMKAAVGAECLAKRSRDRASRLAQFVSSTPNLISLGPAFSSSSSSPGTALPHRLPILSFLVRHPNTGLYLHHNFVTALLNDLFGIQARGGCACAGPYALDLLGIRETLANQYHQALAEPAGLRRHDLRRRHEAGESEVVRPGFVRLCLPCTASDDEVQFILSAVERVCRDGWCLLPQYRLSPETGEWRHRRQKVSHILTMASLLGPRGCSAPSDLEQAPRPPEGSMLDDMSRADGCNLLCDSLVSVLPGRRWLGSVSYAGGCFNVRHSDGGCQTSAPGADECLRAADELFADSLKAARQYPASSADQLMLPSSCKHLRWFLLPSEARAQLLHGPDEVVAHQVPFTPPLYPLSNRVMEERENYVWQQEPRLHYWPVSSSADAALQQHNVYPEDNTGSRVVDGNKAVNEEDAETDNKERRMSLSTAEHENTHSATHYNGLASSFTKINLNANLVTSLTVVTDLDTNGHSYKKPISLLPKTKDNFPLTSHKKIIASNELNNSDDTKNVANNTILEGSEKSDTVNQDVVQSLPQLRSATSVSANRQSASDTKINSSEPQMNIEPPIDACPSLVCFLPRPTTDLKLSGSVPKARWQPPPKELFAPMVEALSQFSMLRDGDRVLVCLSGGKDSLSLLHLLHQYQYYSRSRGVTFDLGAVTVDPESAAYDPRPLIPYLASLGVHYLYEQQGILQLALQQKSLSSICSFCSRLKRGRLYAAARRAGYGVLALGQHLDDLAESFLMSILHNGRLRTMKAAYTVQEGDLRIIRPLVFVRERQLRHFAESRRLPVIPENCPACFEVPKERHRTKQVLAQQEVLFPSVYASLRTALLPLMAIRCTGVENRLLGRLGVEDIMGMEADETD